MDFLQMANRLMWAYVNYVLIYHLILYNKLFVWGNTKYIELMYGLFSGMRCFYEYFIFFMSYVYHLSNVSLIRKMWMSAQKILDESSYLTCKHFE